LVVGLAAILQMTENYVLIPRIMDKAVGVSALVNIVAVLSFGALYGLVGVFLAIPMAATVQVILARLVVEGPVAEESQVDAPWTNLLEGLGILRQRVRDRLRSRESRMGIDPEQADHVIDAVDQRIERAIARVEESISKAQQASGRMPDETRAAIIERLEAATEDIEQTAELVNPIIVAAKENGDRKGRDEINQATEAIGQAVERVEAATEAAAPVRKAESSEN
jgi:hypothetical protein